MSNFYLWKYTITKIVKKEKLWNLFSSFTIVTLSWNKRDPKNSNSEDFEHKAEQLILILTMSIKSTLLVVLTNYINLKYLWDFLKEFFENVDKNKNIGPKNNLRLIVFSKNSTIKYIF